MKEITELRDIQSIQLSMVGKIDEFCSEAGICYFLAYGTLIGAIRHHGFIPWDDDIDLWMLRPDFDRFESEFPQWAKNHGLFLNSPSTEPNYNRILNHVCDSRTVGKEIGTTNEYEEGVFIDIFPVDGLPEGCFRRWVQLTRLQLRKAKLLCAVKDVDRLTGFKRFAVGVGKSLADMHLVRELVESYADCARRVPISQENAVTFPMPSGKLGRNGHIEYSVFEEAIRVPFEGMPLPAPCGYDSILRGIYGDYMQLPPEEARVPHHSFKYFWKQADDDRDGR